MAKKKTYERDYSTGADASILSDDDYAAVMKAKEDVALAKQSGNRAGIQAAHDAAEAIRAKYGYSGGADGSQFIKLAAPKRTSNPMTGAIQNAYSDHHTAPTYSSRYHSQLEDLAKQLQDREPFSYSPAADPGYQAYAEKYRRLGAQARENALGNATAMTGGQLNSYALTAAQQAQNAYNAQLSDAIPQLQQLAYSMYQDEGNNLLNQFNLYQSLESNDYQRYLDQLEQYNADRAFDYGVFSDKRNYDYQLGRDAVSDNRYERELAYQSARDQLSDSRYNQEYADSRSDLEYSRQAAQAETLAQYGDFSGYRALGYTGDQIANMQRMYQAYAAADRAASAGASNSQNQKDQDYEGLYAAAWASPNPKNYIASNYRDYGFTKSAGLSSGYNDWLKTRNSSGQNLYSTGENTNVDFNFNTLLSYAQKMRDFGRSPGEMRSALKKQGYSDQVIGELFARMGIDSTSAGGGNAGTSNVQSVQSAQPANDRDLTITNRNGDGWVYIPGTGRVTYDELERMVNQGRVNETIDRKKGTVTYS